jgi:hypothetical protein
MDDAEGPPLPWEQKTVLGALALLTLQSIHEGILFCAGSRAPGIPRLDAGFAVLLALYLVVAVGLWMRSRIAWWLGVVVIGGFGLLHLALAWPSLSEILQHPQQIATTREYTWDRFGFFWTISRSVLLLSVPALLLLGELRRSLRSR